ncbi:MAG: tetratricopeptide repeat protein, partial [Acidobacteriales bacterium]|nr:tetratricopeptide repeat protein [Terriglobales bacterium]
YQSVQELSGDLERLNTGTGPIFARSRGRWRIPAIITGILILLALSAAAAYHWRIGRKPVSVPSAPVTGSHAERRSVAVIGFRNLSGRPEAAWLSTAIAEMLTTELGAGEHLLTISGENVARVRRDLSLPDVDALAPDTLEKVRKNLGTDFVVLGSFLDLGGPDQQIRLDLRLQDAAAGRTVAVVSQKGSESQLDALVTGAGTQLLEKLGISELPQAGESAVKASMPANLEAARYYAEGLQKMRSYDVLGARDLLQKAVTLDPRHAPSWATLSSAWRLLGYNTKAKEAAQRAFNLTSTLSREERLLVEGQFYTASNQTGKALDAYRSLLTLAPDNVDYGIRLAQAQIYAGQANDALATIAQLRRMPAPRNEDLRIDLAELNAAHLLSDYKREQQVAATLATKSEQQGARLMMASARLAECSALRNLGNPQAGIPACQDAQRVSAAAGDQFGVAKALNGLGNAYYDQGDLERAKTAYREAAGIYRQIGSEGGLAGALDNLASVVGDQGDTAQAKKLSEESLALYRRVDDKINITATLNNIAAELLAEGHLTSALKPLEESLALARQINSASAAGTALTNIGDVRLALGDIPAAKDSYQQSYDAFRKNDEKGKSAYPANGLGEVLLESGDIPGAKAQFQEALELSKDSEKHESAVALFRLGMLALQQGDFAEAHRQLDASIALRSELGEKEALLESRIGAARVLVEEGNAPEAMVALRHCIEAAVQQKSPESQVLARALLAQVLAEQGDRKQASSEIRQAEALATHSEVRSLRLRVDVISARVRTLSGDPKSAIEPLQRIVAAAQKSGMHILELEAKVALGQAQIAAGQAKIGRATLDSVAATASAKGLRLLSQKAARAAS